MADQALIAQVFGAQQALAVIARDDYDVFCNLVLRDERDGKPITQGWIHEAWTQIHQQHDKCLIVSFPEAGKTQQLCVGLVLWELGRNPRLRVAIISRTQGQAIDIVNLIRNYIENSVELRMVFPHLRRSSAPGSKWTETQLTVERPSGIKEPSVQAFGIDAGAITGKRVDRFIIDDALDVRTTRTAGARKAVSQKFWREIYNRRSEHARFVVIGNLWHIDDWYMELQRRGWPTFFFPVRVTAELKAQWGLSAAVDSPTWPEMWTPGRIDKLELDLPRSEFERAYMCRIARDADSPFKQADLDAALERGREWGLSANIDQLELLYNIKRLAKLSVSPERRKAFELEHLRRLLADERTHRPRGPWTAADSAEVLEAADRVAFELEVAGSAWEHLLMLTGVDPSKGTARDPSAIVTTAVSRSTNERHIVEVERGWWELPELVSKIAGHWERWDSSIVFETVGMQDWGRQTLLAIHPDMPIKKLNTTGARKASATHGLPAFAHRFVRGLVTIHNDGVLSEAQRQLIKGALSFDPDPKAHPDDVLMAAWFCDHEAWHATERKASRVGVRVFG